MRSPLLAALLSVALAGCVAVSPEERRADDEASCLDYGFRPGTDAFAACLQRIDLSREADRRERFNRPEPIYVPVYRPVIVRR